MKKIVLEGEVMIEDEEMPSDCPCCLPTTVTTVSVEGYDGYGDNIATHIRDKFDRLGYDSRCWGHFRITIEQVDAPPEVGFAGIYPVPDSELTA